MNNTTNFLPTSYTDRSFILSTDREVEVEVDLDNPLHVARMNLANDAKSTLDAIHKQVERMQWDVESNLQRLGNGSLHFESSTSTAIELDKLQEKFGALVEALRKMDWVISQA